MTKKSNNEKTRGNHSRNQNKTQNTEMTEVKESDTMTVTGDEDTAC